MECIEKRFQSLMQKSPPEREVSLRELAKELGCSLDSTYDDSKHLEHIVVARIREALRDRRAARLWVIALISAVASALSAAAAWTAVLVGMSK